MSNLSVYERQPAGPDVAVSTLRDLLQQRKSQLTEILPKHLTAERLSRIAIDAVSRTPKLLECTPLSICEAIMVAASMGLEVGSALEEGYLVPYYNSRDRVHRAKFIPGYRGLISLARRSGFVLSIEADVVHEKDHWEFRKTQDGTQFVHVPSEDDKPGETLRAYAVARLRDAPIPIVVVMMRREIEAIRIEAKRGEKDSPWDSDYDEMCKKTALRRICKYLPRSREMNDGLEREDRVEPGAEREVVDVTPRETAPAKTAEAIKEPYIEPIADVLLGIEALSTVNECAAHSERLKTLNWRNEDERGQAVAAMKARWKTLADAIKAGRATPQKAEPRIACSACGLLGNHAPGCPNGPQAPGWAQESDSERAAATSETLSKKQQNERWSSPEGDQIQGREYEREPGQEG